MQKLLLSLGFLALLSGIARAGVTMSTSNPPGTPLDMTAGTTSGLMAATVTSDNPPNDIMAAWQFQLEILPIGGTGTLTFADPATGPRPIRPITFSAGTALGLLRKTPAVDCLPTTCSIQASGAERPCPEVQPICCRWISWPHQMPAGCLVFTQTKERRIRYGRTAI